jgi:hypothetical protein
VKPTECEICDAPATLLVQGETDSFGFEIVAECDSCHNEAKRDNESYKLALDVEDRIPEDEKNVFLVSETTNIDRGDDFFFYTSSYREAVRYLRRIEIRSEPLGGLYPDQGVREVSREEVWKLNEVRARRIRDEQDPYDNWS